MKCGFVPSAEHHRYELEGLVFIVEWTLARSMYDSPLSANSGRSSCKISSRKADARDRQQRAMTCTSQIRTCTAGFGSGAVARRVECRMSAVGHKPSFTTGSFPASNLISSSSASCQEETVTQADLQRYYGCFKLAATKGALSNLAPVYHIKGQRPCVINASPASR
jgi:hypothetical protein